MLNNSQARIVSYLCVAAAGVFLAWTLFVVASRLFLPIPSDPAADGENRSQPAVPMEYEVQEIVNAHLFGKPAPTDAPAPVVEQAPETQLSLSLAGVIASSNPGFAQALIGVDRAPIKNYAMGEQIEGTDAKVHTVEDRKVIIERNGQYESLMMERVLADSAGPTLPATDRAIRSRPRARPRGAVGQRNQRRPFINRKPAPAPF